MPNKLAALLTGAMAALSNTTGQAALPQLPPAPAGKAVSELLMMDARQALAAERAKHILQPLPTAEPSANGARQASAHASAEAKPPVLASIYGVGKRLHAQVVIGGQQALFASGQAHPIEGAAIPWRLRRIAPPCIDLESEQAGVMRLCTTQNGDHR